jgi:nucleoside-diphosphate-sugar epimerase
MTRGEQQRDLVYVDDVVEALMLAATRRIKPGSVFNVGSGQGVPIKDVVRRTLELMGNPVKPLLGALPMRPDEIMEMSADVSAAREQLGWQPQTSLVDGLRKTIAWWRLHREFADRLASRPASPLEPLGTRV